MMVEHTNEAGKCRCGGQCWAAWDLDRYGPCAGKMRVSEDYPGEYTHFCEFHGHLDDYRSESKDPREQAMQALADACQYVLDTFARDLEQGYITKDKTFAVEILRPALAKASQFLKP